MLTVSNFFDQIGLGALDIGIVILVMLVVILILFIMLIVVFAKFNKLNKKYAKFMSGKDANSLEKEIIGLQEDNKLLKIATDNNKKEIRHLYHKFTKAFQKIGIVKYDAYQQMGGRLSFSLALLDEEDNGFIFNSVHSTEGCYTYTKEIKNGQCKLDLGNEEKVALDRAMGNKE